MIGRVIQRRNLGSICFLNVVCNGQVHQLMLKADFTTDYQNAKKVTIGQFIKYAINSEVTTSTGDIAFLICSLEVIGTPNIPWQSRGYDNYENNRLMQFTLADKNRLALKHFNDTIRKIRAFFDNMNIQEVFTPILMESASGASARPFKTNRNHDNKELYLRIAPETKLKEYVALGYPRVYEIGKNFRNEGISSRHNPEFTACEYYIAGFNYYDQLDMFIKLLNDFDVEDITIFDLKEHLKSIDLSNMTREEVETYLKPLIREFINPTIVVNYPAILSPMAKRHNDDSGWVEQWQFVMNGIEIAKCYTELVDPVEQRRLLEEQLKTNDSEAMMIDEDFLLTMEYGMPEMSGVGFGIERLVSVLFGYENIHDVMYFK